MVENKLTSFATVIALFTLVTLLIKLIRIFHMHTNKLNQNYVLLVAMLRKLSYFCLKNVVSVTGLERLPISVAKTKISVTGPVRPLI